MDSSIKSYDPVATVQTDMWATMGLPSRGTKLHELVRQGLPFVCFKLLTGILDITEYQLGQHLRISASMLARRTNPRRLNILESDRLCALVGVLKAALELFEGDLSAARKWMKSPVRGLIRDCRWT